MGREERKGRSKFPFLHGEKGSRMQKRLERGQCDLGLDLGGICWVMLHSSPKKRDGETELG